MHIYTVTYTFASHALREQEETTAIRFCRPESNDECAKSLHFDAIPWRRESTTNHERVKQQKSKKKKRKIFRANRTFHQWPTIAESSSRTKTAGEQPPRSAISPVSIRISSFTWAHTSRRQCNLYAPRSCKNHLYNRPYHKIRPSDNLFILLIRDKWCAGTLCVEINIYIYWLFRYWMHKGSYIFVCIYVKRARSERVCGEIIE